MADVVKHAWTHRPRAQGGTDPIEVSTIMPIAYTLFTDKEIDDGSRYALGVLDGSSYGSFAGIADQIHVMDVGGVFRINDDTDDSLWVFGPENRPAVFSYDAACYFADAFDGEAFLQMETELFGAESISTYETPHTRVMLESRAVAAADGAFTLRMSGTVIIDQPPYDEDVAANGFNLLTMYVRQDSGSPQTITQGWMLWTRLSVSGTTGTSVP
jgi:hypothetical protein